MDCEAISCSPYDVLEKLGLKKGDKYPLKAMFSKKSESTKCGDPIEIVKGD